MLLMEVIHLWIDHCWAHESQGVRGRMCQQYCREIYE